MTTRSHTLLLTHQWLGLKNQYMWEHFYLFMSPTVNVTEVETHRSPCLARTCGNPMKARGHQRWRLLSPLTRTASQSPGMRLSTSRTGRYKQNPLRPFPWPSHWTPKFTQLPSSCFKLQLQLTGSTLDAASTQDLSLPAPLQNVMSRVSVVIRPVDETCL